MTRGKKYLIVLARHKSQRNRICKKDNKISANFF